MCLSHSVHPFPYLRPILFTSFHVSVSFSSPLLHVSILFYSAPLLHGSVSFCPPLFTSLSHSISFYCMSLFLSRWLDSTLNDSKRLIYCKKKTINQPNNCKSQCHPVHPSPRLCPILLPSLHVNLVQFISLHVSVSFCSLLCTSISPSVQPLAGLSCSVPLIACLCLLLFTSLHITVQFCSPHCTSLSFYSPLGTSLSHSLAPFARLSYSIHTFAHLYPIQLLPLLYCLILFTSLHINLVLITSVHIPIIFCSAHCTSVSFYSHICPSLSCSVYPYVHYFPRLFTTLLHVTVLYCSSFYHMSLSHAIHHVTRLYPILTVSIARLCPVLFC